MNLEKHGMKKACAIAFAITLLAGAGQVSAATNLVINGGFEAQTVQSSLGYDTFNSISQGLVGWTIEYNNVDLVSSSFWAPASGNNSLDLNGSTAGYISQVIPTVVGQVYTVSFDMGGYASSFYQMKAVEVRLNNEQISMVGMTVVGNSATNMGWTRFTTQFTAQDTHSKLAFLSGIGLNLGPALDNISVTAVPEPETYAMLLAGLGIIGVAARRHRNAASK